MCNNIFTSLHIHIFHLKESPTHLTVCVDVLDVRQAKHRNDTENQWTFANGGGVQRISNIVQIPKTIDGHRRIFQHDQKRHKKGEGDEVNRMTSKKAPFSAAFHFSLNKKPD